ncbi:MAG TPA: oxaloacetate decarboxylase [Candidatus Binatia bacterium]|jgi:methylisocitrate lyase
MRDPRLVDLLSDRNISLTAGVYDALSARLAERAGLAAAMLSGYSVAGSLLGEPDFGILTQTEMLETARRVVRAVDMPIFVDGDTGGGGVVNVQRLVSELVAIGAAGVFLEDQVWPKRCGHMRGKAIVSLEEHVEKIAAARDARGDSDFVIVGRTDARAVCGLDEAVRRGIAMREAGADLVFVEAPQSVDEMRRITTEIPPPLLVNMVEGGHTPLLPLRELEKIGFEVAVYPVTGILSAARALERAYSRLAADGETTALASDLMGFDEFGTLVGLDEKYALAEKYRR